MLATIPWLRFWEIVLCVGIGSFILLILVVIQLGARDIKRMFARLDDSAVSDENDL